MPYRNGFQLRVVYNGQEMFGPPDSLVYAGRYNNIEISITTDTFALCVNSYCNTLAPLRVREANVAERRRRLSSHDNSGASAQGQ